MKGEYEQRMKARLRFFAGEFTEAERPVLLDEAGITAFFRRCCELIKSEREGGYCYYYREYVARLRYYDGVFRNAELFVDGTPDEEVVEKTYTESEIISEFLSNIAIFPRGGRVKTSLQFNFVEISPFGIVEVRHDLRNDEWLPPSPRSRT